MTRSKKTKPPAISDAATQYALEVVAGERIAGPHVRGQCARHLRDIESGHKRGLVWKVEAAEKAQGFFEDVLKLNGGDFEGKPFALLPWQRFVIGSLFGWMGPDGHRRFRNAYIETAKGSGKSPLAAGVGMKGLVADNEPRAEIYSAATKKDQAMILFRDAVAMVDQSPELSKRLQKSGTGERCWNLAYMAQGAFFRPISSDDGQSGPRPHIGLIDELHEHKTNTVVEMMRAGTKSRRQAMIFMITNAGHNRMGPCWSYHEYGAKVAAGEVEDDAFFPYVCSLDEQDDPFADESCWPKANPSLQDADLPGMKYIREQVVEAKGMPSKEAIVRRLNFCQWTDAESPWISGEVWRGAQRDFDWQDLRGRRAVAGHTPQSRLLRTMRAGAVLCVVLAVAYALDLLSTPAVAAIVSILGLVPALMGIPGAVHRARRGDAVGMSLLLAWLVYFLATATVIGIIRGWLPVNFWTLHSFEFGATVDMLLFMRVLGLRTKALRLAALDAHRERDVMRSLAHSDALTGLPNRRGLNIALTSALSRCSA